MTEEKRTPSTEVSRWVDRAMYEAEPIETVMPKVYLLSATPDPLGAIAAASKMYEGKVVRDLADVTDDERRHYFAETFKTHLKAPLEFVDLHFLVEGVTRAWTHQAVRQRTAVFAQESLRFAVKEEIAARPGTLVSADKEAKKQWDAAIEGIWSTYQFLIQHGIPAEEARGLLPHDTLTRMHYKTNLRNLADHLGNRLCTQAQVEWRYVASQLRQAIREYAWGNYRNPGLPSDAMKAADWQFREIADSDIFQPICFTTGQCMFKAGMDRGCTIRGRVDEGKFDEIGTREWLTDPTAGWVR